MFAFLWTFRARLVAALAGWRRAPAEMDAADFQDELVRIRLTAELAADLLSQGAIALVSNPWKRGSRGFVLWETSYHARLMHNEFESTWSEMPDEIDEEAVWWDAPTVYGAT